MRRPHSLPLVLAVAAACLWAQHSEAAAQQQRRARRPPESRIVPQQGFAAVGPDVADTAPDFTLADTGGGDAVLSELWSEGALVLVLGSVTSGDFRKTAPGLQRLADGYTQQGVRTVLLYTLEAHPAGGQSPYGEAAGPPPPAATGMARAEHRDAAERLEAARFAAEKLGLEEPLRILVDGMDNAAWSAYGPAPNNAFLIDRGGYVVARQAWFDPDAMEGVLLDLLVRQKPPAEKKPEPAPAAEAGEGG
jgi:hypothetical protein